jgi:hypothetical protein
MHTYTKEILGILGLLVAGLIIYVVATITPVAEPTNGAPDEMPGDMGKINIVEVCQGALAYMTFPDAAAADTFVQECVDGKHPDVIQRYFESMPLGNDAEARI